ncbi:DNA protecting protein DprA [Candidatus Kaiserbacteria bacterium RIFCSPHIGHO2_02_FULL_49_34]|uniref:DNA protecting protein DprA n=1 Tax=Candidatus Kaiserbacteria bacterium RIFCSPHIGHO2_02_FULL_49_34 TaxID=1798491 RepID=A0A1F6DJ24_9BACT|nr:MAG: DNA protecting protein DprA [Candidatus Kaiserbacteria bacterium RIFCSPHIGHO2_02_FULL_49_34]
MYPIHEYAPSNFPALQEIPDVPKELFMRGAAAPTGLRFLAVVGSRDYTNYGKQCVQHLIKGLRGYPISIVSGLALGIDGLAHEAALDAGLHTIAIPGSGIADSVLYPRSNRHLAARILREDGMIMSEFAPEEKSMPWMFPARNRIIAGIADAVLLIEAKQRSGTLITARLAHEYNKDLLVVPGNIFSENTAGVHQFLKLGAIPVTSAVDIIHALHLPLRTEENVVAVSYPEGTPEATVLHLLREPTSSDSVIRTLQEKHQLNVGAANTLLMRMELMGEIASASGMLRRG